MFIFIIYSDFKPTNSYFKVYIYDKTERLYTVIRTMLACRNVEYCNIRYYNKLVP